MIWRVVLDSNIYLSGILFKGVPAELLLIASHGGVHVLTSSHILQEVERKLLDKFKRDPVTVRWELQQIRSIAESITSMETVDICRDPDDNRILECASAGQANCIVTGDRDLLVLNSFRGIPILTARQFLDHLSTPHVPLK